MDDNRIAKVTSEERFRDMLHWDLELQPAQDCLHHLRSRVLRPATEAFVANSKNVDGLHMMPFTVAASGVHLFYWTVKYIRASLREPIEGKRPFTSDVHTRIERANELLGEFLKNEENRKEFAGQIDNVLVRAMSEEDFQRSAQVLLLAETVFLWTTFECLCKDVWIAALDSGNTGLAQRALRGLPSDQVEDGISRKSIEVGVLAKHGFDLRHCLGTVLVARFKFSDPDLIRRTYVAVFETPQKFEDIFDRGELKLLAATRHLIAHRGGIVDEKYRQTSGSSQVVGETMAIDARTVSTFATSALHSGVELLQEIDARL